ncbi:MAG TPA: urease accessory UreF family protein [Streptosporangiaceae bacterium]|jgi:urease accessory protein|nr:urease accessory UreF family protein [Streptosporangiaceae bacterium]
MASDDPPRRKPAKRKPDWRAPDTGRGPDTGEGPEVGRGPEVGERPDTGRGPEVGPRPDTGKSPDVGTRPDTGESPKFGRGPEVGPCPDTGRGPEVGPRPDFGESPDVGESPDTSRIEEDRARLGSAAAVSSGGAAAVSSGGAAAVVLMLADARFPAGGHAHSGGLEGAVTAGTVSDVASLELFLAGRLATTGVVAAGLAATACAGVADVADGVGESFGTEEAGGVWGVLDAEADARTPSPAQRDASRRQGRALLRAARAAWPSPALNALAGRAAHHPIVLGATAAAAGCTPAEAALIAAYLTVTGPASAAVRLLALDPIEVSAAIARLADAISAAAARGAQSAGPGDLPYPSAPALDLYAEAHARAEVRLFAS